MGNYFILHCFSILFIVLKLCLFLCEVKTEIYGTNIIHYYY